MVVNILDGPTSSITANTNDLSNSTKNILNSKGQFNFIELETNLFEITKKQSVIDQYFKYIIILIFLFLLFSVLSIKFILFKKSKSIDNNKIANRMAVKSLENAKKLLLQHAKNGKLTKASIQEAARAMAGKWGQNASMWNNTGE